MLGVGERVLIMATLGWVVAGVLVGWVEGFCSRAFLLPNVPLKWFTRFQWRCWMVVRVHGSLGKIISTRLDEPHTRAFPCIFLQALKGGGTLLRHRKPSIGIRHLITKTSFSSRSYSLTCVAIIHPFTNHILITLRATHRTTPTSPCDASWLSYISSININRWLM